MTGPSERRSNSDEASPQSASRSRSVSHPRYSLEQVEELARRAFAMGARHCDQDAVAQAVNYKNATNGAFKGIRAAASYFGLITYKDDRYVSVTEPWIEALHADDQSALRRLRQEAVRLPELYGQLIEEFSDRQLPSGEKLARQLFLAPKYGILKDAAEQAARVFLDSVRYAGLIDQNNFLRNTVAPQNSEPSPTQTGEQTPVVLEPKSPIASGLTTVASQSAAIHVQADTGLDRLEVQLAGGRRAFLLVPVPLTLKEKERLKRYIDLILEPEDSIKVEDSN